MKKKPIDTDENIEKRAAQFDARAQRAEVRRLRALERGVQSEADGAMRTIEEAKYSAARLRAQLSHSE
jgi:hypothetical protein